MKNNIINAIISLLIVYGLWWCLVPAISIHSPVFLIILLVGITIFGVASLLTKNKLLSKLSFLLASLIIVILLMGTIFGSRIFNAKKYASRIQMLEGNFEEDLVISNVNTIPTIDRDMGERLGNRSLGSVVELVSQFDVSPEFIQISAEDKSVRVSPLQYASIVRWFYNQRNGIPYYVYVDMVSGESKLVHLDDPIMYSHADMFNRDIKRHIRNRFLTTVFTEPSFEIDDTGKPYYVASALKFNAGLFGAKEVDFVITVDATDGTIKKHELNDVPKWVDRVYPSDLILTQINDYGSLQSGWFNSVFGQKGVIQNAEGYNYIVMNNDLYLYTGLTSVANDESNIGFVLSNSRTKETRRYDMPLSTEWSAMESAEGSVQEKGYVSTFPLLLNMNKMPIYMVSLKDDAGLIKMYAFVDGNNYQRIATGNTLTQAWNNYTGGQTSNENQASEETDYKAEDIVKVSGTISSLANVVVNGDTVFYFTIDGGQVVYKANISVYDQLPFLKVGDVVNMDVVDTKVISITK